MGLPNAASLALLFGSRLVFMHAALERMFLPPFADAPPLRHESSWSNPSFDFAKHGERDKFGQFAATVWLASTANKTAPRAPHAYQVRFGSRSVEQRQRVTCEK